MGAFEYTAVDPRGKEKKGVMEGDTPRRVRQLLRDKNLIPLSVTENRRKRIDPPAVIHNQAQHVSL